MDGYIRSNILYFILILPKRGKCPLKLHLEKSHSPAVARLMAERGSLSGGVANPAQVSQRQVKTFLPQAGAAGGGERAEAFHLSPCWAYFLATEEAF
jgi:hypothetical protein